MESVQPPSEGSCIMIRRVFDDGRISYVVCLAKLSSSSTCLWKPDACLRSGHAWSCFKRAEGLAWVCSVMLGWKKPVFCFFCNHEVKPRPPNSQYFRCVECDCWNRYDKNGGTTGFDNMQRISLTVFRIDFISDERAMYEETLNADAFSKRGQQL